MVQKRTGKITHVEDERTNVILKITGVDSGEFQIQRSDFTEYPKVGDTITFESYGGLGSLLTAMKHKQHKRVVFDTRAY